MKMTRFGGSFFVYQSLDPADILPVKDPHQKQQAHENGQKCQRP